MREQAQRYCSPIERDDSLRRDEFVAALAESLAGLLAAAARLPDVSPTEVDLAEGPPREHVSERFAAVHGVLGEWDGYWTTMAPLGDDAEESASSAALR